MSIVQFAVPSQQKSESHLQTSHIFPMMEAGIPSELDAALAEHQSGDWRYSFLTAARMLRLELLHACRPSGGFLDALREVWQAWRLAGFVTAPMPGSDALAHARARQPAWPLEMLFKHTAHLAQGFQRHPLCLEHRLLSIDGTTLCLPNSTANRTHFGTTSHQQGEAYFPKALAVWVSDTCRSTVVGEYLGTSREGDERIAPFLLQRILQPHDLVLGDAKLGNYPTLVMTQQARAFFLMRAPGPLNVETHITWRYSPEDADLRLGLSAYTRKGYPDLALPDSFTARTVVFTVPAKNPLNGVERANFLTNLPRETFPVERLAQLAKLRWNHETMNNDIKTRLGLETIRSASPEGVRREVLSHLCVANWLRHLMFQAQPESPGLGSFTAALTALRQANATLRVAPQRLAEINALLLAMIYEQPIVQRPGRAEPRMTRPRRRPYPIFKTSRAEWHKQRKVG